MSNVTQAKSEVSSASGALPATLERAEEQADALNSRAWELRHEDAAGALELADQAYTLATLLVYPKGIAHSLLAKAFAQFRLARLQDARTNADALNNSGSVYTYLGDYVNALDYYQQSLRVYEEQGHLIAKERALLNIGVTYFELGQYYEALNYFSSVSTSAERNPQLYALSLLNSGRAYQQLGDVDAARG